MNKADQFSRKARWLMDLAIALAFDGTVNQVACAETLAREANGYYIVSKVV